jgi:hypothetical protein
MFKIGDIVYLKEDTETLGGVKFSKYDKLIIVDHSSYDANSYVCRREDGVVITTGVNSLRAEKPFETCMDSPVETEDVVNHPSHYESGKFECIEVMEEALGYDAVRDFCICNAFKYLYRHKRKNGYEDIKKAQWYINKYVDMTEKAKENGLSPM